MTATTENHKPSTGNETDVMKRLSAAISAREITTKAAALQIGVTLNTLERHLRGEHVRSDSVGKYEDWLSGRTERRKVFRNGKATKEQAAAKPFKADPLPTPPERPYLVVDLFAGCGGLSLGFDLLGKGRYFRTVLAMDIASPTARVMNQNHATIHGKAHGDVARVIDLTEFLNETEVLAIYMEQVSRLHRDTATRRRMDVFAGGLFPRFLASVQAIDLAFIKELSAARDTPAYKTAYGALDKGVLGQTSVIGFHDALKLPRSKNGKPSLRKVIWSDVVANLPAAKASSAKRAKATSTEIQAAFLTEARQIWDLELTRLESKEDSDTGKGQLTSSARRIKAFGSFVRQPAFEPIREAWCKWQASRLALRQATFQNEEFSRALRSIYEETYPVAVLLGGPPCQGFSRIGRGKIRSLREAHVHVQGDEEAGDSRNFLYQRYLLVVSALRPPVFKFENVQHFQSSVKTDGKEFLATDILAEAIAVMSDGEASYAVASRIVDASEHGVPQARQRFFMSGIRRSAFAGEDAQALASGCLLLPHDSEVPLSCALDGLPDSCIVGGDSTPSTAMSDTVPTPDHPDPDPVSAEARYRAWIRQPAPGAVDAPTATDGHASRAAREDDAELFALLGPGKRWMDYRVDRAPTLAKLRSVLAGIAELPAATLKKLGIPSADAARELVSMVDGSLALRLIMETVGERLDAPHHLVKPTYLAKRDGNHGDWLARLDGTRPCKTILAHMGKDTYGYVHPSLPRTLSVREAARIQTFPDWFSFSGVALTDAMRMLGNAVPPLISYRLASRVADVLDLRKEVSSELIAAA